MPRPEKELEYGGTYADVQIAIGKNLMHDSWTAWLKSEEAVEIVARGLYSFPSYQGIFRDEARSILSALAGEK